MLLGTDFNDKINRFAYLKKSQGDLKVIINFTHRHKFYLIIAA